MKAKRYNFFRQTIVMFCLATVALSVGCCGKSFFMTGTGQSAMSGPTATQSEKNVACIRAKANADALAAACPRTGDKATYTKVSRITIGTCSFSFDDANNLVTASATGKYKCCDP